MKVKELIALLQRHDQEAEVVYLTQDIHYEGVGGVFTPLEKEMALVVSDLPHLVGEAVVGLG